MNHTANLDDLFMRRALDEAQKALDDGEIPIGAVIVADGQIIGRGHNMTEALNDVTAHAEMMAITSGATALGGKYLKDCTLYVTIEPCLMCAGAIAWAQIPRIVFGASDPKRGFSTFTKRPFHPKATVIEGVMADECAALMKNFFLPRR